MLNRENSRGRQADGKERSQVERLVDILFSAEDLPAESADKIRRWLVDTDREEEKSTALYAKFIEQFRFDSAPVLAPALWPQLAGRLGMNPSPSVTGADPLANSSTSARVLPLKRPVPLRRLVMRVAAVLVPVALIAGAVMWTTYRQTTDTLVELSVSAELTQTFSLPDGSLIELDQGGVVTYDGATFAQSRVVKLRGDALFDVVSLNGENGERMGFTVETNHLAVNVLGTVFRVEDQDEGGFATEVSLYSGSVEVSSGTDRESVLVPGQRLVLNTLTGEHTTELIPASEMAEFGAMPRLVFDEASLGDLVLALERNFDVKFTLGSGIDPARGKYSADFEGLTLDRILGVMTMIEPGMVFKHNGTEVTVRKK
jgi:ferric-dicitrate binding protein FerR (iron transport regulator)